MGNFCLERAATQSNVRGVRNISPTSVPARRTNRQSVQAKIFALRTFLSPFLRRSHKSTRVLLGERKTEQSSIRTIPAVKSVKMPFLSRDWRSPGEKWVRYDGGWERKKIVHRTSTNVNLDVDSGCEVGSWSSNQSFDIKVPERRKTLPRKRLSYAFDAYRPHCHITLKNTREVAGFNGLAEALLRLDFVNAVKDIRRFDYVSKIMYSLFNSDKLMELPGAAQKVLFRMLEEMADSVYKSGINEHVLRSILDELNATMSIYHVWGSHLGGSNLFKQHAESRRKITDTVEKMQGKYKQDLATPSESLVQKLPEECIREIMLRLSNPKDVERAGDACQTMSKIAKERRVWRELVQTHFTKNQIDSVLKDRPDLANEWKSLYQRLRRRFGLREEYTEMLHLCRKCRSLFWQSLGHPCLIFGDGSMSEGSEDEEEEASSSSSSSTSVRIADHVPIKPQAFLTFFSV